MAATAKMRSFKNGPVVAHVWACMFLLLFVPPSTQKTEWYHSQVAHWFTVSTIPGRSLRAITRRMPHTFSGCLQIWSRWKVKVIHRNISNIISSRNSGKSLGDLSEAEETKLTLNPHLACSAPVVMRSLSPARVTCCNAYRLMHPLGTTKRH